MIRGLSSSRKTFFICRSAPYVTANMRQIEVLSADDFGELYIYRFSPLNSCRIIIRVENKIYLADLFT